MIVLGSSQLTGRVPVDRLRPAFGLLVLLVGAVVGARNVFHPEPSR